MAKLSNIVEHKRSLWAVVKFAFVQSIKGAKRYSLARYSLTALTATFVFVEFGALGKLVNEFAQNGIEGARISVIVGSFVLIALSNVLPSVINSILNYVWLVQSDDMSRHLQKLRFEKMDELDIGTVEQPEFQNVANIASGRGWSALFSIVNIMSNGLTSVVALVLSVVSLAVISPAVVLVILIGALPIYFIEKKNAELAADMWQKNSEKRRMWESKTNPINDKNSLVELKNFSLVATFFKKWNELIIGFHGEAKQLEWRTARNEMISSFILVMAYGIAFALIIMKVYSGAILIGSLVFSFSVIARFQSALNTLFENFGRLSEHKKNLDVLMNFLEMKPMILSGEKAIDPAEPISIEFQNVSFSYPGTDRQVLTDISLSFKSGDNIAIVGLNGAGKTTLIKLLTRVYDPTSGEIFVNGVPLREYDLKSWKKCLGILLQEYSMYSEETIAENIMLGDVTKHDQGRAEDAAKETTAHEFIESLADKYQQRVGTEFRGGVELSKGQKQKVALARVLYRNAPILVLDEPTASVDALSEDAIFKNLKSKHPNQARIVISHKFSNVRDADQIILIEHGRIIEEGSHDELIRKENGMYRELFELQAEGYR